MAIVSLLGPEERGRVKDNHPSISHVYVSGQVASHTNNLPHFQGTMVIPSGHFPPLGSRHNGILVDERLEAQYH